MKNKIRLLWITPLIVAVASALIYFRGTGVETAKPRVGPVLEAVYGLGTVVAPHTYQLKTGVNLVLKKIFFKEGENIFPQIPVVTLVSLEDLYMEVSLEQQAVLRVRKGQ